MIMGDFGTGKTIFVLAIVVGCFAILWPKVFYPMLTASLHGVPEVKDTMSARPERPGHLHPEMMHPALREKGRALPVRTIEKEARPGPMPGIRPPMGGGAGHIASPHTAKGLNSMSVIMPLYTVGIIIFFMYTFMKILFKKNTDDDDKNPKLKDFHLDPEYRKYVFEEEYLDSGNQTTTRHSRPDTRRGVDCRETSGLKKRQQAECLDKKIAEDEQMDHLRERLEETERAMEKLMSQMGSVSDKLTAAKITEVLSQAQAQAKLLKMGLESVEPSTEEAVTSPQQTKQLPDHSDSNEGTNAVGNKKTANASEESLFSTTQRHKMIQEMVLEKCPDIYEDPIEIIPKGITQQSVRDNDERIENDEVELTNLQEEPKFVSEGVKQNAATDQIELEPFDKEEKQLEVENELVVKEKPKVPFKILNSQSQSLPAQKVSFKLPPEKEECPESNLSDYEEESSGATDTGADISELKSFVVESGNIEFEELDENSEDANNFNSPAECNVPVVTMPKFEDAPEVTMPKFEDAPEVTMPKFKDAPEVIMPKFEDAPEVTMPKFEDAPEVTMPKFKDAPEVIMPKFDDAPEVTMPKFEDVSEVIMPSFENVPDGTIPTFDVVQEVTMPKFNNVPEVTMTKFEDVPEVTMPKFDKAPEVTMPKFDKAAEVTMPKFEDMPEVIMPKFDVVHEETTPKFDNVPEVTMPKYEDVPEVTMPKFEDVPEVTMPKFDKAPEVTMPKFDIVQEVTMPKFNNVHEVTMTKFEEVPEVTIPKFDVVQEETMPEVDSVPKVTMPEFEDAPGVTTAEVEDIPQILVTNIDKNEILYDPEEEEVDEIEIVEIIETSEIQDITDDIETSEIQNISDDIETRKLTEYSIENSATNEMCSGEDKKLFSEQMEASIEVKPKVILSNIDPEFEITSENSDDPELSISSSSEVSDVDDRNQQNEKEDIDDTSDSMPIEDIKLIENNQTSPLKVNMKLEPVNCPSEQEIEDEYTYTYTEEEITVSESIESLEDDEENQAVAVGTQTSIAAPYPRMQIKKAAEISTQTDEINILPISVFTSSHGNCYKDKEAPAAHNMKDITLDVVLPSETQALVTHAEVSPDVHSETELTDDELVPCVITSQLSLNIIGMEQNHNDPQSNYFVLESTTPKQTVSFEDSLSKQSTTTSDSKKPSNKNLETQTPIGKEEGANPNLDSIEGTKFCLDMQRPSNPIPNTPPIGMPSSPVAPQEYSGWTHNFSDSFIFKDDENPSSKIDLHTLQNNPPFSYFSSEKEQKLSCTDSPLDDTMGSSYFSCSVTYTPTSSSPNTPSQEKEIILAANLLVPSTSATDDNVENIQLNEANALSSKGSSPDMDEYEIVQNASLNSTANSNTRNESSLPANTSMQREDEEETDKAADEGASEEAAAGARVEEVTD